MRKTKALTSMRGCAGWSAPVVFANPLRQFFTRVEADNCHLCRTKSIVQMRHTIVSILTWPRDTGTSWTSTVWFSSLSETILQMFSHPNMAPKLMRHYRRRHVTTVLSAKSDSDVMFCLQNYQGPIIDRSLVYKSYPADRINTHVCGYD